MFEYIFFNDDGIGISYGIENANPIASPLLKYGSCPIITTFSLSKVVSLNAWNMKSGNGYIKIFSLDFLSLELYKNAHEKYTNEEIINNIRRCYYYTIYKNTGYYEEYGLCFFYFSLYNWFYKD